MASSENQAQPTVPAQRAASLPELPGIPAWLTTDAGGTSQVDAATAGVTETEVAPTSRLSERLLAARTPA